MKERKKKEKKKEREGEEMINKLMRYSTLRSLCNTRFDSLKWAVGPLGNPIIRRASENSQHGLEV